MLIFIFLRLDVDGNFEDEEKWNNVGFSNRKYPLKVIYDEIVKVQELSKEKIDELKIASSIQIGLFYQHD